MNNNKSEQIARQKVEGKVEFRIHLISYIVVNIFLAIINLSFTPEYLWIVWPLLGWGTGLTIHGLSVYFSGNVSMKERMIEEEIKKRR